MPQSLQFDAFRSDSRQSVRINKSASGANNIDMPGNKLASCLAQKYAAVTSTQTIESKPMFRFTIPLVILVLACHSAGGQCPANWLSGPGFPGVGNTLQTSVQSGASVRAICRWDPDGSGPQPPLVIVAGTFSMIGSVFAANIAAWNGRSWSPLGLGLPTTTQSTPSVRALLALPNGHLLAAGYFTFTTPSGVTIRNIARWDGTNWYPLGWGIDSMVNALALLPNGDIIAGGQFSNAGASFAPASRIARWNGTSWSPIGSGVNGEVKTLASCPNSDFVAGGSFSLAGGLTANGVARAIGNSWSPLGSGVSGGGVSTSVDALVVLGNGNVVAGGTFTTAGTTFANGIAVWNGLSWMSLGLGITFGSVTSISSEVNGDLVVGGTFLAAGGNQSIKKIARWSGGQWTSIGPGYFAADVYASVIDPSGSIVVGGNFGSYIDNPSNSNRRTAVRGVARWNGQSWGPLGADFIDAKIAALAVGQNGDLIAGGDFTMIRGTAAERIARWNGSAWLPLGNGVFAPYDYGRVRAIGVLANGDIVVGGNFTHAGGVLANHVARWNGQVWSALGAGFDYPVESITILSNDEIVACGSLRRDANLSVTFNGIARWNGTMWVPLGGGLTGSSSNAVVYKALALDNGDIVAGGNFSISSGAPADGLARWDGVAWQSMGLAAGPLLVAGNGDLIAVGPGSMGVVKWNGAGWWPLGGPVSGQVRAAVEVPNGNIIIGGSLTSIAGVQVGNIARFDGVVTWSQLGSGLSGDGVYALALLRNGDLVVGGGMQTAGNLVSACLGPWGAPRPMVSQVSGSGGGILITDSALGLGHEYYSLFSLDLCPSGAGSGPVLGLCFPNPAALFAQVVLPIGSYPFHFVASGASLTLGPYAAPVGLAFELINVDVTGGVLGCISPAVRFTVQ